MDDDLAAILDAQIAQQGVGCVPVDGGWALVFPVETLEALLLEARKLGKVVFHVSKGAQA
jgi:hypothetical protein